MDELRLLMGLEPASHGDLEPLPHHPTIMIRLISILGSLAILAQFFAVLYARHTALTWQGTELKTAVVFSVFLFQLFAMPPAILGLLLGIFGMWRRNHWGRPRALRFAVALSVLGMIPFGLSDATWRGAWQQRVKEYQATHR